MEEPGPSEEFLEVAGVDAARNTQVSFTTHSRDFLDAFPAEAPTTSACDCEQGETHLRAVDATALQEFLAR